MDRALTPIPVGSAWLLGHHVAQVRAAQAGFRIGAGCEVGIDSVVLYDAEMEEGSRLDAVSLLMKGERLPAGSAWVGSPLTLSNPAERSSSAGAS